VHSHLLLLVLFALLVSIVFAVLMRDELKTQFQFSVVLFGSFVVGAIVLGWLMYEFLYAGLALLILRALAGASWRNVTIGAGVAAVLLSAAYGATDEFHQRFVPGRTADLLDLAADTAGAAAAVAVVWLIARWRRRAP